MTEKKYNRIINSKPNLSIIEKYSVDDRPDVQIIKLGPEKLRNIWDVMTFPNSSVPRNQMIHFVFHLVLIVFVLDRDARSHLEVVNRDDG